ncbi:MAG: hypothetical protein ACJ73S_30425 [Mycobacteriales bacterium]|jgi:hypothetical protein
MGASRDDTGSDGDVARAWGAVRRRLGGKGGKGAELEVYAAALAAAVADMTAEELAVLRRKGRVPDWFVGEVRRHFRVVDRPNLKDAQVRPLTYEDTVPMKHAGAAAAALGGMMSS